MDCRRLFITGGNFPLTVPLPSAVFWGQTPFEARKHWVKRGLSLKAPRIWDKGARQNAKKWVNFYLQYHAYPGFLNSP